MIVDNGDIIHLNNCPVDHRETKFVLVVDNIQQWCFCINTENRLHYNCFVISKGNHNFLKNHEHYVACANIIKYKQENITKKCSELSLLELEALKKHVLKVRTLNSYQRDAIVTSLSKQINKFISSS